MPLSKYFKGSGEKVMGALRKTYGPDKAENVFYGLVNKNKNKKKHKSDSTKDKIRAIGRG